MIQNSILPSSSCFESNYCKMQQDNQDDHLKLSSNLSQCHDIDDKQRTVEDNIANATPEEREKSQSDSELLNNNDEDQLQWCWQRNFYSNDNKKSEHFSQSIDFDPSSSIHCLPTREADLKCDNQSLGILSQSEHREFTTETQSIDLSDYLSEKGEDKDCLICDSDSISKLSEDSKSNTLFGLKIGSKHCLECRISEESPCQANEAEEYTCLFASEIPDKDFLATSTSSCKAQKCKNENTNADESDEETLESVLKDCINDNPERAGVDSIVVIDRFSKHKLPRPLYTVKDPPCLDSEKTVNNDDKNGDEYTRLHVNENIATTSRNFDDVVAAENGNIFTVDRKISDAVDLELEDAASKSSLLLAQAQSGFSLEPVLGSLCDVESLLSNEIISSSTNSIVNHSNIIQSPLLNALDAKKLQVLYHEKMENGNLEGKVDNISADLSKDIKHCWSSCVDESGSVDKTSPTESVELNIDLEQIPEEILLLCFSYLSPLELCCHVAPVCRQWYNLAYDSSLWKKLNVSETERRMTGPVVASMVERVKGAIRLVTLSLYSSF